MCVHFDYALHPKWVTFSCMFCPVLFLFFERKNITQTFVISIRKMIICIKCRLFMKKIANESKKVKQKKADNTWVRDWMKITIKRETKTVQFGTINIIQMTCKHKHIHSDRKKKKNRVREREKEKENKKMERPKISTWLWLCIAIMVQFSFSFWINVCILWFGSRCISIRSKLFIICMDFMMVYYYTSWVRKKMWLKFVAFEIQSYSIK